MTTVEEELISYIVTSGDLDTVLAGGITEEHLLDPANRRAFQTITAFRADYGEVPTPDVLMRDYPAYPLTTDLSGPLTYLLDQLHEARRLTILDLGLGAVADALDKQNSTAALDILRLMLAQAASQTADSREIDYIATGPQRLLRYQDARDNPNAMLGMPTGWRWLDKVTRGLLSKQMIVFTGLAKSCKTTVMLIVLKSVYDWGANPLVVSFEMSEAEISRRLDGFGAQVNPRSLQTGEVNAAEWNRVSRYLAAPQPAQDRRPLLISEDRAGTMTLSGLQAKIDQYKPDILFLDGAYFLVDEITKESGTPLALTNISRGLKKLAMNSDIPVVVTTQSLASKLGRNGLTAHSLGYTSAWVQDADLVVGMEACEDPGDYRMKILAARNAPPQEHLISISWDPPTFEEADLEDDLDLPY
ncbi:DnaB-like helicase C-terminal domain-containing protein [Kitasatospora purpeofusca]|uniref:DnaB-like helicase C-terminal domain-containing protein n=1 Tax=Kitasatospora purpeofusca TaxID=67352 RepID=UPI0036C1140A